MATAISNHRRSLASAEIQLANRLRQLRNDKQLTLTELADIAGMSQAYLSRVENHKSSLTIAGLEQLAAALNVPMSVFFEVDERNVPITVCRARAGLKKRISGREGFSFEMLAHEKKGKLMEPLIVEIGTEKRAMPIRGHAGEEFNYVISGECVFVYGDNRIRLHQGDAVYYDASIPHTTQAVKGKLCRILSIVASRDYLFHGDLTRLLNGATNKSEVIEK